MGTPRQTLAVVLQLIGYAGSKLLATKLSSEARYVDRVRNVIGLVSFAQGTLLGFALVPPHLNRDAAMIRQAAIALGSE